jgi:hypothetical protein
MTEETTRALLQWAPIIASLVALIASIVTFRASQNNLWQRVNDAEIQVIQNKLDTFYGPLIHRLESDHLLARDLRDRQPDKATYRLLIKLFDVSWKNALSSGDRVVVDEICAHAAKLEAFIYENAGLVDEEVSPYLVRATTHFRILYLANSGGLGGDAGRFARYVYPKHLDAVLRLEVSRLKQRMETLRNNPSKRPPAMPRLEISPDLELDPWPDPPRGNP